MKFVETVWGKGTYSDIKYTVKRLKIERSMNFMAAHRDAQKYIMREFQSADSELSEAARVVINESEAQWQLAEAVLHSYKRSDVENVASHKFCTILLNSGQHYISKLVKAGLLKDDEAEHWVEGIEHHLEHVYACNEEDHPGELKVAYLADAGGKFRDDPANKIEEEEEFIPHADDRIAAIVVSPDEIQEMFKDVQITPDGSVNEDDDGAVHM